MNDEPSQAELARALGLAKSRVTAMKKRGMPVHSIDAARAWRVKHLSIARRKPEPVRNAPTRSAGELVAAANQLLAVAALALDAGQSIAAMVPMLRGAMAAVPGDARGDVELPLAVIRVLAAHVLEGLPPQADNPANDDGSPMYCDGSGMSDDEAQTAGEIWYQIAAGEVLPD
jgi:hypothetical protein